MAAGAYKVASAEDDALFSARVLLAKNGYTFGRELGCGSYSTVRLVQRNGVSYACKIVSTDRTSREYRTKFLPRELKILSRVKHSHITEVYQIIQEPRRVLIIMELALGGDLLDKIQRERRISEEKTHELFVQLACALAYLHRHDVAHRDLKCENVLLTADGVVKLTDFSFSRFCVDPHTRQNVLSRTFCGSEAYAAPEILQGICYLPKMDDMWSLGVILYIMVTGALPFDEGNIPRQIRLQMMRMVRFPKNLRITHAIKNLIRSLLEPVVTLRSTMGAVVHHPWIRMFPNPLKMLEERYAYQPPSTVHVALRPPAAVPSMHERTISPDEEFILPSPIIQRGKENLYEGVTADVGYDQGYRTATPSPPSPRPPPLWPYQSPDPVFVPAVHYPSRRSLSENTTSATGTATASHRDTAAHRWLTTNAQAEFFEPTQVERDDMGAIFDNLKTEVNTNYSGGYTDEEQAGGGVAVVALEEPVEAPTQFTAFGRVQGPATAAQTSMTEHTITPQTPNTEAALSYPSTDDLDRLIRLGNEDEAFRLSFSPPSDTQKRGQSVGALQVRGAPSQYLGRTAQQAPSQFIVRIPYPNASRASGITGFQTTSPSFDMGPSFESSADFMDTKDPVMTATATDKQKGRSRRFKKRTW